MTKRKSPSPPTESVEYDPSKTILTNFLRAGEKNVAIYVWNELQKVSAQMYIDANREDFRDAVICIVVSQEPVTTGDVIGGAKVIRCHFTSNGGGGR